MKDEFFNSVICIAEKVNLGLLFIKQTETKDKWEIITLNKPFFTYFNHPFTTVEGQLFSDSWVSSIPEIASEVDNFSYQNKPEILKKNISVTKLRKTLQICFNKNTILFLLAEDQEAKSSPKENIDKELFQTLLNYSPDLIYFKDKEARFIKNSQSHCNLFGIKQEELIGKTDLDVFEEENALEKYEDDIKVIRTGEPIINKEEIDIKTKGVERWVSSSKLPIKNNNGEIIGLFGISRDITDKKMAETKIKRLNENFQELITTGLGFQQTAKINNLFRITGNLILEKFNNVQLIFVYKKEDIEKIDVISYPLIKNNMSSFRDIIEYILSNDFIKNHVEENGRIILNLDDFFSQINTEKIRTTKCSQVSIYHLNEGNESFGYALIFRDSDFEDHDILFLKVLFNQLTLTIARINLIDELTMSMQKAKESDRLKTAFLNNISHEVRTPLNSVIGYSQLLIGRTANGDARLKTFAENVVTNSKLLLELFDDIIEISKLESGKISIIRHETNINELIDSLDYYLKEQLKRQEKTHINTEYAKPLPTNEAVFYIDSIRVFQILKALASNAVKFTENGNIKIGYTIDSPNDIKFFVEDTGIGISEEASNIIFNLFRQGDESVTRKYGGVGVGLSIANALAENLGGKITFNTKPNEGTIFLFSIPVI